MPYKQRKTFHRIVQKELKQNKKTANSLKHIISKEGYISLLKSNLMISYQLDFYLRNKKPKIKKYRGDNPHITFFRLHKQVMKQDKITKE